MMTSWKRYMGGGIAFAAAVAFASTLAVTSVQADHRHSWNGIVMGGIIGGAIGSTIGKGSGRLAAIGVGTLLGSIHGRHLAEQHHRPWVYHRPAHRQQHWQGHRGYHHGWQAPRHRRHHDRYRHGWQQPQAYAPIVLPPRPVVIQPRPVVIQPRPVVIQPRPVVVQPRPVVRVPEPAGAADYVYSGSARVTPRHHGSAQTECRVLEDGWSPVYACRGASGNWHLLR